MPYQTLEDLPSDLKEQLLDGSQQIFMAAFNSTEANGMDQSAATHLAWNTIQYDYVPSSDGKWHRKPEETGVHGKSTQSGGN